MLLTSIIVVSLTGMLVAFASMTVGTSAPLPSFRGNDWIIPVGLPSAALLINAGLLLLAYTLEVDIAALLHLGGLIAAVAARILLKAKARGTKKR